MKMDYITRKKLAEKLAETSQANLGALGWGGALAQGLAGFGSGYMGAQNAAYDKEQKAKIQAQILSGDTAGAMGSMFSSEDPDMQKVGLAAFAANAKPKEDYTVGNTRLSGTTNKPVFTAPEKPNLPPAYQMGEDGVARPIPGVDPSFLRKNDGTSVNINNKMESEYSKVLGSEMAKERIEWGKSAATAKSTLNNLDSLEGSMNNISTGQLEPAKASLAAFIEGVGGKPERYNLPSVKDVQAFNAVSNIMVLDIASAMKGSLSDKDLAFLKQAVPTLGTNPQANNQIMDIIRKGAKGQIRKYNEALTYEQQNGNIGGFEKAYQDKLMAEAADAEAKAKAQQPPQTAGSPQPVVLSEKFQHGQQLQSLPDPATFPAGKSIKTADGKTIKAINGKWITQ